MRTLGIGILFVLCSSLASACSCSNSTPIEKTDERYSNRAVFTARVVQLMGGSGFNGKRYSGRVVAVVHHRYWGLPAYWPSIVILDGGFFCGIGMYEEEYLVSGIRSHYGVVSVGMCSRTQPLATAQVDLRTLDGSLCTGAGGTLIGKVSYVAIAGRWVGQPPGQSPVRNAVLTFRDFYGKAHITQSDSEGVYALRHVPPGPYTLDSHVAIDKFVNGGGVVRGGVCQESPVELSSYDVSGRLAPTNLDGYADVVMAGPDGESRDLHRATIASDGRFYFQRVPPGEYSLTASFGLPGHPGKGAKVYFPGTSHQEKAIRIRVSDQTRGKSFDFDSNALPLVSIPFIFESPRPSRPMRIHVHVLNASGISAAGVLSVTGTPISVAAVRGESYEISALGYSEENQENPDWQSETVQVTAAGGMKITPIAFPAPR